MAESHPTTVEPFSPGDYIRDELDARGWTQKDFAAVLDFAPNVVNEIIKGKRSITTEIAEVIGAAFETGPEVWLNVQSAYRLAKSKKRGLNEIVRKSKLYSRFAVQDMMRRRWIENSSNVAVLETQICEFFRIQNINDPIDLPRAARHSKAYGKESPAHDAWFGRVRNLASIVSVSGHYSVKKFRSLISELKQLCMEPSDVQNVRAVLSNYGIRIVIVEHLPRTKLDGGCLWLDSHSPVIGLSMRYERIDYFWFTLFHELFHIKNKDRNCVAAGLYEKTDRAVDKPDTEKRADANAANALIDSEAFDDFVLRKGTIYSTDDIIGFSLENKVHPGIMVGQLHHRVHNWTLFNKYLVKVRDHVIESSLTDGWGVSLSI